MNEKMKDSGVEWIGEIPKSWKILPLGNCFSERNEKVADYDWEPLSVTKQGIVKQLDSAAKSDAHDARKKVCKDDFVINSRSDRKQSCGVSPYDGSVSLINIVLQSRFLSPDYVKYLLKNYGFAEEFYRWGTGIVADLWSTKWERMKKIMLPIPPQDIQEKIAKQLDDEIFKIDERINITKQIVEDYKKYKQSVITEAVTKGLDPDVEMKDSGVEWIGEVPKHWKIKKIKHSTNTRNEKYNESFGVLNYFGLENIVSQSGKFIDTNNEYDLTQSCICNKGDVVFGKLRPYLAKVYEVKEDRCCSGEFAVFYNFDGISTFYKYLFLSYGFIDTINASTYGTKMPRANIEFINNIYVAVPPIEEQVEIVNYLTEKCNGIDNLIASKEATIEELESYKKSLIYEFVTGKKEVE